MPMLLVPELNKPMLLVPELNRPPLLSSTGKLKPCGQADTTLWLSELANPMLLPVLGGRLKSPARRIRL